MRSEARGVAAIGIASVALLVAACLLVRAPSDTTVLEDGEGRMLGLPPHWHQCSPTMTTTAALAS